MVRMIVSLLCQEYSYLIRMYRGLITNTRILQLKWGRVDGKLIRRYICTRDHIDLLHWIFM